MQPAPDDAPHVPYSATDWGSRVIRTDEVAQLLGIKPTSLYQLVLRDAFPEGQVQGRDKIWMLDTVLRFMIEQRRQQIERVPRLFPRVDRPIPALFCGSRLFMSKARSGETHREYIAHMWQPSDGGPLVALVYKLHSPGWHRPARELLTELHEAGHTDVGAVVIPSGSSGVAPDGVIEPPEIDYADTSPMNDGWVHATWFDVAYLLQVDLPWWPHYLRDAQAMLRWQPGDAPYAVVPRSSVFGDPHALLRLGSTVQVDDDRETEEVARFFWWWAERAACGFCPPDTHPAQTVPGICVPVKAVAPGTGSALSADVAAERGRPTPEQTARVLHTRVDPEAFDDVVCMLAHGFTIWSPLIERVVAIRVGTANPLARRFLSKLSESDAPVDELGYLHVCAFGRDDQRITQPLSMTRPQRLEHELNKDLWIAQFGNTVYITVPQSISTARGELQQLDITQDDGVVVGDFSAWWTDTDGYAWPMPGEDPHEAGYSGAGPDGLAAAATILADDAASPVGGPYRLAVQSDVRYQQLAKQLKSRRYPTLIRRLDDPAAGFRWHTDIPSQ
ncbi:hypothetical protein [Mycolicibacterium sp. 120270]|uniref:helix-turn-helix transcriptional regulator n=1 Tax=Mycolicibacterium sp. 120270 TaxID=3090600 RepID=UPI00299EBBAF|nr:hypothetical protein [Mycolicibacterium sp. 120270]MDX1886829.1 hypothetical protein [Mycolicibacterium sp. 120270]